MNDTQEVIKNITSFITTSYDNYMSSNKDSQNTHFNTALTQIKEQVISAIADPNVTNGKQCSQTDESTAK